MHTTWSERLSKVPAGSKVVVVLPPLVMLMPSFVTIRSSDAGAAAHPDVVGAFYAGTTAAEIDKQIVIAAMLVKAGAFLRVAEEIRTVVGNAINGRGGGNTLSRGRIQLHDQNAVGIGTERHPDRAVAVHQDARVNAIVSGQVRVGGGRIVGFDDFSLIGPDR